MYLHRSFQLWRRLARALEPHGLTPQAFIDIDPKKIGRTARGQAIIDAAAALERAVSGEWFVVVALGGAGARDVVRDRLARAGLSEGQAFICAA